MVGPVYPSDRGSNVTLPAGGGPIADREKGPAHSGAFSSLWGRSSSESDAFRPLRDGQDGIGVSRPTELSRRPVMHRFEGTETIGAVRLRVEQLPQRPQQLSAACRNLLDGLVSLEGMNWVLG